MGIPRIVQKMRALRKMKARLIRQNNAKERVVVNLAYKHGSKLSC
jgi:hypothetical protein